MLSQYLVFSSSQRGFPGGNGVLQFNKINKPRKWRRPTADLRLCTCNVLFKSVWRWNDIQWRLNHSVKVDAFKRLEFAQTLLNFVKLNLLPDSQERTSCPSGPGGFTVCRILLWSVGDWAGKRRLQGETRAGVLVVGGGHQDSLPHWHCHDRPPHDPKRIQWSRKQTLVSLRSVMRCCSCLRAHLQSVLEGEGGSMGLWDVGVTIMRAVHVNVNSDRKLFAQECVTERTSLGMNM